MITLSYARYRAELATQIGLLRSGVRGADLTVPVPGCPGWNLAQLLRHVGGTHHWAAEVVRTRATEPVAEDLVNEVADHADADPGELDSWLAEGARLLTEALGAVRPEDAVWTPGPGGDALFWARRMTFEAVVHRADASQSLGTAFALDEEVALDGVEEWMGFTTVPEVLASGPGEPPLLGAGRVLRFEGLASSGDATGWLVDLTGDTVTCGRTDASAPVGAAVTVRAPLADLLLLFYRRRTAGDRAVTVEGDAALLDLWLERSGFWLRE
ncbi:maleylpyruvate isomerase family mycothiol-dependent enzyme [Streptomyces sp. NPDC005438]|uniref:maleylpyruvate isomerase family mycothiol-dependent enzyme n=1 Tax=Streptomyces sp. NPDC005438 TaxID=3156880 RepID=UPI0033BD16A4